MLYPLRRIGRKGEGRFERITWDEALDEIAERLAAVRRSSAEAIWPLQGTGTLGYIQGLEGRAGQRLWNVLGASLHDMTICSIAGGSVRATRRHQPGGMDPETFAELETDPAVGDEHAHERAPPVEVRHEAAQGRRAHRRHRPAAHPRPPRADEHLAPLPGHRRGARARAAVRRARQGAQDDDYLANRTLGWDAFRERILEFPPDRVGEITGLRASASSSSASGSRRPGRRPSAPRWASSATPAAA